MNSLASSRQLTPERRAIPPCAREIRSTNIEPRNNSESQKSAKGSLGLAGEWFDYLEFDILALVSDWKARPLLRIRYGGIRNFESCPPELSAVIPALLREARPCVLDGDLLGL
jgi:hypothetical protein